DVDEPAVDRPPAGHDAVAVGAVLVEAELGAAVADERAELLEGVRVEEEVEALAGGELAFLVLLRDAGLAAAELRFRASPPEVFDGVGGGGGDLRVGHGVGGSGESARKIPACRWTAGLFYRRKRDSTASVKSTA